MVGRISCASNEGIIIAMFPDVCIVQQVSVPFPLFAKQSDASGVTTTVKANGLGLHTKASIVTRCSGDEAGQSGIKSGTIGGVCQPKTWASNIVSQGNPVVRHNDEWWMNNKNTIGKLFWI
jgi:hypothetical protein